MRTVLHLLAVLLMLIEVIWFLQGMNILPGSFMTGNKQWAVNGGIAFAAGVVLLLVARRVGR